MSLKYTTSLFRLKNSHKLYSCLQSRTFCEDSSHKTNNHIGSETKLGKSKKNEEEKATSEKLKIEEVLKSLSQKSASRSSPSTGKNEKKRSYTGNVADNKKSKKHSTDIKSDFFASLKEGKRRVSLNEGLEKSDKNADEAKLKMAELLKSFTKESLHSGNRIPLSQPKPRKKMPNTKTESVKKDPILDLSVNKAVKDVANEFSGDPNEIESDLFASLKSHSAETSLSELLATMKIDRSPPKPSPTSTKPYKDSSQKSFGRFKDDEEIHPRSRLNDFRRPEFKKEFRKHTPTDLNSGTPLNIFSEDYKGEGDTSLLATWELIAERDKKVAMTNFPRNAWEEMIQWTEEGKIWTFPIDNEIGLEEEKRCGFADHIFLEHHLEGWCPKKGPIRRYMDLVCTGLSKNPFLTVERKKAHIKWYQNYFEEKKLLLKELGAM